MQRLPPRSRTSGNSLSASPDVVACDMHPDYLSTDTRGNLDTPVAWVQHHYAHVVSCMVENELEAPVWGILGWAGCGHG